VTRAKISEYSATANDNTDVNGVNIAEGCPPSSMNNMGREIMAALKRFQVGSDGDGVTVGGALVVSGATTANTFSATAVNATGTVTFSGSVILSGTTTANTFSTDLITEKTSAAGVTVDGVLLKDSQVTTDQINEKTSAAGVTIDSVLLKDGLVNSITVGRGAGAVSTNTAVGASALAASNSGTGENVGVGYEALKANTTGSRNTAVGLFAAGSNTTGANNVAIGNSAFQTNTTGGSNVAVGNQALQANTTASSNTAVGYQAGYTQTTGDANTFLGFEAGYSKTTSASNTFVGAGAGYLVSTGAGNTIIGRYNGNTGGLDIRTASNHIVLSDGDGNPRLWSNNLGRIFVPEVYSGTTGASANVVVAATGQLERSTSSIKYKRDVQDATHGLAEVMQLRPVTYKGKSEGDGETVFGGLIAEEVHDAGLTEFVQYNPEGEPDALAYGNMVSLCVKAIQELSAQVTALQAEVNALKGQ